MGCDIHPYLDRAYISLYDGKKRATNIARLSIDRNYGLFAAIADVRNSYNIEVFIPKGLPADVSYIVEGEYTLYVVPNNTQAGMFGEDEGTCSLEQAKRWGSKWWRGNKHKVKHPDYHSASWLTTEELETAYHRYLRHFEDKAEPNNKIPEIEALIGAMIVIDNIGDEARFIFWFDN